MERYDAYQAIVRGCSRSGIFLDMENGETAFAFYGRLPIVTHVIVSVLKLATEKFITRVTIESVCYADVA